MDPRLAARRHEVQETTARRRLGRTVRLLIAISVVAVAVFIGRGPWFRLDVIRVDGAVSSGVNAALADAGVAPGVPLVSVDPVEVAAALEEDPWVKRAIVERRWPRTLRVSVDERYPVAWALSVGGWHQVAIDGVTLSTAPVAPEGAVRVVAADGASLDLEDPRVLASLSFADALRVDIASSTRIEVGEQEIVAEVEGYSVRLGGPIDMAAKARALAAVLDERPPAGSLITILTPTRPAVKPPESTSSTTTTVDG